MSARPRFLSRRALLKIAAASTLAPFALSPFGRAEMEAAGMTTFTDKAKRDRFYKVAENFWKNFEDGVKHAADKQQFSVVIGPGVFAKAVELSGGPLVAALDCFDDDGKEKRQGDKDSNSTCINACAGISVSAVAKTSDPKTITPEIFELAWELTKAVYGSRVCGISGPPDPNAPPDPNKISAFGC